MSEKVEKDTDLMEEDVNETESSTSDSAEEEEGSETYSGNEELIIDFEGRTPVDPDSHGIAQMLSRLFLKAHVNCMQMADLIIAQNYVGSVIAQCESDEPVSETEDDDMCEEGTIFGITTVINITAKKDTPCIEQLRTYIIERAEKYATDAVLTHFRDVLGNEARPVGFLINERFINIPAQISIPLLQNLSKEVKAAKAKGMPFEFVYFLMIMKCYRKAARKGKPAAIEFSNAEEELICKRSVNSFEFSVANESDSAMTGNWSDGKSALTPYRKVVLLDAKILPELIVDIQKFINGEKMDKF